MSTGRMSKSVSRRTFLKSSALGISAGWVSGQGVSARAGLKLNPGQKSVVMIYLPGGPTQFETFDPKPESPVEIRGSFLPTQTKVPGVQFCELLPRLSSMADRFSVIRTLVGMENRYESF